MAGYGGAPMGTGGINIDMEQTELVKPRSNMLLIIVIALVSLLILLLIAAFFFFGDDDETSAVPVAVAAAAGTGTGAGVAVDACMPNPCYTDVTCTNSGTTYTCDSCPTGYSGDGETCTDTNSCEAMPCYGDVACTDLVAPAIGHTCAACPVGTIGDGTTCADIDGCAASPCYSGVACTDTRAPDPGTGFTCAACPAGFNGDGVGATGCIVAAGACATGPCYSGVTCSEAGTGYSCGSCPVGTAGDGTTCDDVDGCAGSPCFAGVACTDARAPATGHGCALCPPGFAGDGTTCADIDGCATSPCFSTATVTVACTDSAPPLAGHICAACPAGFLGDGELCSDIDGCLGTPCYAGVACTDIAAPATGYNCGSCPSGFTGDGISCTEVVVASPCSPNPCTGNGDPDGVCTVAGAEFTCACGTDFVASQSYKDTATNTWVGTGTCLSLATLMAAKEAQLTALADQLRNGYSATDRCTSCACSQDACTPNVADWNAAATCISDDTFGTPGLGTGEAMCPCGAASGREMSLSGSTVTVDVRLDRASDVVKDAVCASKSLDATFNQHANDDRFMRTQRFGSEYGPIREYPGNVRSLFLFGVNIDPEIESTGDGTSYDHFLDARYMETTSYTDVVQARTTIAPGARKYSDGTVEPWDDYMGCEDCVALGYSCAQCQKFNFDCSRTCATDGATAAREEYINRAMCKWDDPQQKSWYVSAVTGQKHMVLVLDMSKSLSECAGNTVEVFKQSASPRQWVRSRLGAEVADDTSATCQTRLDVLQAGVKAVLNTLNDADYMQVVIYGDHASCYSPGSTPVYDTLADADAACPATQTLIRATAANVDLLSTWVDSLSVHAAAGTDWYAGFQKAFVIFSMSNTMLSLPGCTKILMFFTDGVYDEAAAGHAGNDLTAAIRSWNSGHDAHIIWYTLPRSAAELINDYHLGGNDELTTRRNPGDGGWACGTPSRPCTAFHDMYMGNVRDAVPIANPTNMPWAGNFYAKRITCENHGIWIHVAEPVNLAHYMASYYEIFQRSDAGTSWGEPGQDPLLADKFSSSAYPETYEVLPISKAVFAAAPNADVLLGVVQLDIPMSYFGIEPADCAKALAAITTARDSACTAHSRDKCVVDKLRYEHGVITSQYAAEIAIETPLTQQYGPEGTAEGLGSGTASLNGWAHFSTCCRSFDANTGTADSYGGFATPFITSATGVCQGSNDCPNEATPRGGDPSFVCSGAAAAPAICIGSSDASLGVLACCGGLGTCTSPPPAWTSSAWSTGR